MDQYVNDKIASGIKDRKDCHIRFVENCKTYTTFSELEEKAFRDGFLMRKQKESMALSISIVTKCEPCIEWHVQQALITGASEQEIFETIAITIEMSGGPATAYARYALIAIEYHKSNREKISV